MPNRMIKWTYLWTQLFKNDNHEELFSNMEIYLQNIKWKKQDTELYLYYNYNCLKCMLIVKSCCVVVGF